MRLVKNEKKNVISSLKAFWHVILQFWVETFPTVSFLHTVDMLLWKNYFIFFSSFWQTIPKLHHI
jgi:hypothetical protein